MGIRSIVRDALAYFTLLDGIFRRFVWSRVHFAEDEMRFLNQIDNDIVDVAVDVGAALGAYSWIMNRKSRKVYAFEPGSLHNKYLNRVTFCTNIEVINSAVGSTISRVKLHTPGSDTIARHSATVSTENHDIIENDVSEIEEDQVTRDSFVARAVGAKSTME